MPRRDLGQRLAAAMKASADCKTQGALAQKAGVSQSTVGRLLHGLVNSQRDTLENICTALRIPLAALLEDRSTGEPDHNDAAESAHAGLVPLISWVQAGSFTEPIDLYQPGYAELWIKKPPKACGPQTFALRVEGISMEPDYLEGDVIYVDPGITAINGKDVVIRIDSRNETSFKRLVIERQRRYLKPLNRAWPEQIIEVPEEAHIVGVIIGTWRER